MAKPQCSRVGSAQSALGTVLLILGLSELESLWAVKRQLVFPPIEARIDETWQRIVDFFKGHFLPAWRAARSSTDTGIRERLIQVDEQYTDWLVQHFFDLSLLPSSPLADRVVQRSIQRCTTNGMRVVWLVVDGASWHTLTDLLESALREHGAHTTSAGAMCRRTSDDNRRRYALAGEP